MSDLLPPAILSDVIDLFFQTINAWFPILHWGSIRILLESLEEINDGDQALVHAITAATLRFVPKQSLDDQQRWHHRTVSLRKAKLHALNHVSERTLQILVILCVDTLGTSSMGESLALLERQLDLYNQIQVEHSLSSCLVLASETMADHLEQECLESIRNVHRILRAVSGFAGHTKPQRQRRTSNTALAQRKASESFAASPCSLASDDEVANDAERHIEALQLLLKVQEFSRISLAKKGMALRKDWRTKYAGFRRAIDRSMRRSLRSKYPEDGMNSFRLVHLTSTILLHSSAISVLLDVNWTAQIAIDEIQEAISQVCRLFENTSDIFFSPLAAVCLRAACHEIDKHVILLDAESQSDHIQMFRILQKVGRTWDAARLPLLEHNIAFSPAPSLSDISSTPSLDGSHYAAETPSTDASFPPTPGSWMQAEPLNLPDDNLMSSCFDWARYDVDRSKPPYTDMLRGTDVEALGISFGDPT